MDRSWKSFKMHVRKSLDCLQETVHKKQDVKGDSGKSLKRKKTAVEKASIISEIDIYYHQHNIGRNININGVPGKVLVEDEEHIIGGKVTLIIRQQRT